MSQKTRILIADDNPNIRQTLGDILSERGYAVDTVKDGYELLSYLRGRSPDVLILDLIMPQKDGIEVFSAVKGLSPNTKIIIYTAFQRYEYSLYAQTADKFLLKSESPDKLLEAIAEVIA
jgi:CheY-like chemotaxis protein